MLPSLTLALGGAASGKSAWAETLLLTSGLNPVYIATGRALDLETQTKINLHKARRGPEWQVIEAPERLASALRNVQAPGGILLDCATMWLTNRMMADATLNNATEAFLDEIRAASVPIIVVSNELGQGIVPDNAVARAFREAHGRLNIAVAARADLAVQVVAGLPNVLKGHLP